MTRRGRAWRQRRLLAALLLGALATPASAGEIGQIRARLYYVETGRLSDNIAPPAEVALWNTVIGGGSAEEPATDMLVEVETLHDPPGVNPEPLRITATAGRRVIARRTVRHLLQSKAGRSWTPLFLRDVGCAGPVTIVAQLGTKRRETVIPMRCGE